MDALETIKLVYSIAKACHGAVAAYSATLGANLPPWDELTEEEQKVIIREVEFRLQNPEAKVEEDIMAPSESIRALIYFAVIHAMRPGPEEKFTVTALHMPALA